MIELEDAFACVRACAPVPQTETVALERALGRVLAASVCADRDYPPFARVTMDGYAVGSRDFARGDTRSLALAGAVFAGQEPAATPLESGSCLRIMTGAALPLGSDAVVKQEDCTSQNGTVVFAVPEVPAGMNVAPRGEDARMGAELVGPGHLCTPAVLGLLATVGCVEVPVSRAPRARILVTGDEVVPVRVTPGPVQIRASNATVIAAYLESYGMATEVEFLPDSRAKLVAALHDREVTDDMPDLLVFSGGVSVGDRDFVSDALVQAGFSIEFHGVNIKPGKPVLFGRRDRTSVFGLPGNPFAVQVALRILVDAWLRATLGLPEGSCLRLPFRGSRHKKGPRPEFFGAVLDSRELTAVLSLPHNGSGDVTAGVGAEGLALQRAAASQLESGDPVEFYPLRGDRWP